MKFIDTLISLIARFNSQLIGSIYLKSCPDTLERIEDKRQLYTVIPFQAELSRKFLAVLFRNFILCVMRFRNTFYFARRPAGRGPPDAKKVHWYANHRGNCHAD